MQIISTDKAPAAVGPYSQGTEANGLIFTAGQIPLDPATGKIAESIEEQAAQALKNVMAILEKAGPVDILNVTVYLTDLKDFGKVNEIYATFFQEPYPARSCVEVSSLPKGAKIEVAAIAVRKG